MNEKEVALAEEATELRARLLGQKQTVKSAMAVMEFNGSNEL